MKVSLVVMTAGKAVNQAIPITLSQFIIGLHPHCNFRRSASLIGKPHFAILVKVGRVEVRDSDRTNGTFENEKPIKGEAPRRMRTSCASVRCRFGWRSR